MTQRRSLSSSIDAFGPFVRTLTPSFCIAAISKRTASTNASTLSIGLRDASKVVAEGMVVPMFLPARGCLCDNPHPGPQGPPGNPTSRNFR